MTTLPTLTRNPWEPTTAAEVSAGLRAVADLLDANPDMGRLIGAVRFSVWFADDAEELRRIGRAARKAGAQVVRDYTESTASVDMTFGAVTVFALADRSTVCERVKVGTEVVEVPDPAAAPVTVERDVYEWRCSPEA